MFQHATIGIIVANSKGEIIKSNDFANRLFGYEKEALIGQKIEILVPDALKECHVKHRSQYHQKPVEREMGTDLDLFAKRKDASTFPVSISLGFAQSGNEKLVIAYISDATKQKNYEQTIRESKFKLENYAASLESKVRDRTIELEESQHKLVQALSKEKELGELKSRFVSMASHEFRTPLSMILSSAELLGMYLERERYDKFEKNITRIKSSVNNLTNILNDFLSLEKLEAGKIGIQNKLIKLSEFTQELHEEIQPILREDQQLIIDNQSIATIHSDPHLLKNILINLISNAIKYSVNGTDVQLNITKSDTTINLAIIDHGIGIPDEDKVHMFTRFFRASNVENIPGTGLGLTIVRRYLDLLKGKINFKSEYGKGSTFVVSFPLLG
jgi:PAS domain S-box-containing protein